MDLLNYTITILILLMIIIITLIVDFKKNIKKIGFMIASMCLSISIIVFGVFIYDLYFLPNTSEGKAITFIMRTFMLDDHLLESKNITTGFITLSVLLAICLAFFSYFIIKYVICKRHLNKRVNKEYAEQLFKDL